MTPSIVETMELVNEVCWIRGISQADFIRQAIWSQLAIEGII